MFGLDKASRELDRDLVPTFVKLFALSAFAAIPAYYFFVVTPDHIDRSSVRNEAAFGCYIARGQSPIIVDHNGLVLPNEDIGPIDFEVRAGGSGKRSYLELSEPLDIGIADGKLTFGRGENLGTWRAELKTRVGGSYLPELNDLPIASLTFFGSDGVPVLYRRQPLNTC